MNSRSLLLLCTLACTCMSGIDLRADAPALGETAASEQTSLTPAQLDELLSPIALYPDPLIAIILPASTFPADVVLAARHLRAGGDAVETQPWDDSVKALARYPEVVKWMDENLVWTRQVGTAFALQPADVLTCTQRLRAAARAAGNLNDSPEQTVVVERETIRIVPARTEVIYVPVYDPAWVYRPRVVNVYHPWPLVRFSTGYRTGYWLSYHCNWDYKNVVVIGRPYRVAAWKNNSKWSCPAPSSAYAHHVWRPDPIRVRAVLRDAGHRAEERVSSPTSNSNGLRQTAKEKTPAAVLPVAQVSSPSTAQVAPRPTQFSDSRRGQAPQPSPVSVAPTRGDREPGNLRAQNRISTPAPNMTVPRPRPTIMPAAPSTASNLGASHRIQSSTTNVGGGAASSFRPRPTTPPASNRITAPARETSTPVAASRRERDMRTAPSPSSFERSTSRASNVAAQSMPMSRMRPSAPAAAPMAASEAEASGSRRAR